MAIPGAKALLVGSALSAILLVSGCTQAPAQGPPREGHAIGMLRPGRLVIDVYAVPGREPAPSALDGLKQVAQGVGSAVDVHQAGTLPADAPYTAQDLVHLVQGLYQGDYATWRTPDGTLHILALFLDSAPSDPAPLGSGDVPAWGSPVLPYVVVFPDAVPDVEAQGVTSDSGHLDKAAAERALLVRSYGTMIGLVGCGIPQVTPRGDADHPCSSSRKTSVMFWGLHDPPSPLDSVREPGPVWRFDADDWADIRAYQATL